jgi:serine/threonine-protein kinase
MLAAARRLPAAEVIGGRYCIEGTIGEGGMGMVELAYDPVLNRRVAIKRCRGPLPARLAHDRLRREARLAARLDHRAVIKVYDLVDDDEGVALVMGYVLGPSLEDLHDLGPVAPEAAVGIARAIAAGLEAIHEQGILHLDLKLENVLLGANGAPVIVDFGIARLFAAGGGEDDDCAITGEHVIEGTPRVMSPEQINGQDVDVRSDLFSFGVLLYELLSGETPFANGNHRETLMRAITHHQVPLATLGLGIPPALSDLVECLLEKEPAARPQSAAELVLRLQAL